MMVLRAKERRICQHVLSPKEGVCSSGSKLSWWIQKPQSSLGEGWPAGRWPLVKGAAENHECARAAWSSGFSEVASESTGLHRVKPLGTERWGADAGGEGEKVQTLTRCEQTRQKLESTEEYRKQYRKPDCLMLFSNYRRENPRTSQLGNCLGSLHLTSYIVIFEKYRKIHATYAWPHLNNILLRKQDNIFNIPTENESMCQKHLQGRGKE